MVHNTLLTENECKLIEHLFRCYYQKLSINELAKKIAITPKGMQKLLLMLEKEDLVKKDKIGNSFIYYLDMHNSKTEDLVKYILKSKKEPNAYTKLLIKDLQFLKDITQAAVLFGSVLEKGMHANDIDLFVVIDKKDYKKLQEKIKQFEIVSPKKIHLLVQTKDDLIINLHNKDAVVLEVLQNGYILNGHDTIYNVIKYEANKT